jgi:aryl-alcohol dehydrogenase-like predicted oxidoreductase
MAHILKHITRRAGKIRHIDLSQPSPATLRRVHKVHPIVATQVEAGQWSAEFEVH